MAFGISSLGTTYAKADLSNAATKSFGSSSRYIKFNNGLLIQWGTRSGVTSWTNLYLPISFYDINYTIQMTGNYGNKAETVIYVLHIPLLMELLLVLRGHLIGLL